MVTIPAFVPGPYLATFRPRVAHRFRPTLGEIAAERTTPWWSRSVNTVVIAAGSALALATYSQRNKPLGALAFGAGVSIVGVGLTFLLVDLLD